MLFQFQFENFIRISELNIEDLELFYMEIYSFDYLNVYILYNVST